MVAALHVNNLHVGYGAADVLRDISIELADGECVAVLGANGAGKSTLLRALSGLIRPRIGSIAYFGQLSHSPEAWSIARLGVAHVPEGRGTIATLSVEENLLAGAYLRRNRRDVRADIEQCFQYFPILRTYRRLPATSLSGGEQQMLALSRAIMMRPRIMLLDEPSFGLAPKIVRLFYDALAGILRDRQMAVLLVEQTIELAQRLASRAYLLKNGRVIGHGAIETLRASGIVAEAYLSRGSADD